METSEWHAAVFMAKSLALGNHVQNAILNLPSPCSVHHGETTGYGVAGASALVDFPSALSVGADTVIQTPMLVIFFFFFAL